MTSFRTHLQLVKSLQRFLLAHFGEESRCGPFQRMSEHALSMLGHQSTTRMIHVADQED